MTGPMAKGSAVEAEVHPLQHVQQPPLVPHKTLAGGTGVLPPARATHDAAHPTTPPHRWYHHSQPLEPPVHLAGQRLFGHYPHLELESEVAKPNS